MRSWGPDLTVIRAYFDIQGKPLPRGASGVTLMRVAARAQHFGIPVPTGYLSFLSRCDGFDVHPIRIFSSVQFFEESQAPNRIVFGRFAAAEVLQESRGFLLLEDDAVRLHRVDFDSLLTDVLAGPAQWCRAKLQEGVIVV